MLAVMRAPKSYTGEDTVEVYCHGGGLILRRVLNLLVGEGARPAGPGEFTQRAFLSGRIDLTQAEAVMDLIRAKTEAGQRAAMAQLGGGLFREITHLRMEAMGLLAEIEAGIDFSEEDLQLASETRIKSSLQKMLQRTNSLLKTATTGKILREGVFTAIVGRPNVGKSSLLNALLMRDRAIVTPIPGTTRDLIEESLNMEGIPFRIMDTAGLQETNDLVEREGIDRSRSAIQQADLVLIVLDATQGITPEDRALLETTADKQRVLVFNKCDLLSENQRESFNRTANISDTVLISALTGKGLDEFRKALVDKTLSGTIICGEQESMINERHTRLLMDAKEAMIRTAHSMDQVAPAEIVAVDLRVTVDRLGEITGDTTTEDLLDTIFGQFCVGK